MTMKRPARRVGLSSHQKIKYYGVENLSSYYAIKCSVERLFLTKTEIA